MALAKALTRQECERLRNGLCAPPVSRWSTRLVETTAKPLEQYLALLDAYADHGVASHWYAVPTVAQERILQAAAVLDVQDLVHVWHWPLVTAREA